MKIIQVNSTDIINDFLSVAGNSLEHFRYFNKRKPSAILNHISTLIITKNDIPVAYGHLDPEGDNIWLGICVVENQTGKGYGAIMMNSLLNEAIMYNIKEIKLIVDCDNHSAIHLYEKFGFQEVCSNKLFKTYLWK